MIIDFPDMIAHTHTHTQSQRKGHQNEGLKGLGRRTSPDLLTRWGFADESVTVTSKRTRRLQAKLGSGVAAFPEITLQTVLMQSHFHSFIVNSAVWETLTDSTLR